MFEILSIMRVNEIASRLMRVTYSTKEVRDIVNYCINISSYYATDLEYLLYQEYMDIISKGYDRSRYARRKQSESD